MPSKLNVVSFSKIASFWKELGVFSSLKARTLSTVKGGVARTGHGDVKSIRIGRGARVVVGVDARAFFLPFNFKSPLVRCKSGG